MKPLYCGNIEYAVRQIEIERLFGRYGRVDRVDMKSGIVKSIRALPEDPVHIHSSWHQSASRFVQQNRYTKAILHLPGDTITFHPSCSASLKHVKR